jgi:hypothetical protein
MIGQCIMSEMNGSRARHAAHHRHTLGMFAASLPSAVKHRSIRAFLNAIVARFRHF